jgi:hypothetical protein
LVEDAWKTLMGRPLPSKEEIAALSEEENTIRSIVFREAHEPLRIVLGYEGYQSEFQLRRGMINFLKEQLKADDEKPVEGLGIESFPHQIMCRQASLVKANGMPYGTPISKNGWWAFLVSRGKNPLHIFLELLWTRLAYIYKIDSSIFGEDLQSETFAPLLDGKWRPGWEYRFSELKEEQLSSGPESVPWEPETATLAEYVVVNQMCNDQEVKLDDPEFIAFLEAQKTSVPELVASLTKKRLVYEKDGRLNLLTDQCECVILPDGRYIVGENKTGRLMRWVNQFIKERKKA